MNPQPPLVALARCTDYAPDNLDQALSRVLAPLGGMARHVAPGAQVLIKPNMVSARNADRHVCTNPAFTAAVTRLVLACGGKPVIADSPAIEPFSLVARRSGIARAARELGVPAVPLDSPVEVRTPPGSAYKKLELARLALESDVVINLPKLKTHAQMLLTLGVKNLFGCVVAQRKAEWHYMAGVDRDAFASLHLDIYRTVAPALTILDGVWGMEGNGPSNGTPRFFGMLAASENALAMDMVLCRTLGVPMQRFPLYRAAKARGIEGHDPDLTALAGDPLEAFQVRDLDAPRLDSLAFFPGGFNWFSQRFLASKPVHVPGSCTGCGKCRDICPPKAITLEDRHVRFDYRTCIRCYCCQEVCHENSIRFKKGLLVRALNRLGL
jgi:uncharacterized protein (DUF362 family)/Pyruvate/2-oxoacid:ferredoxin oxidoreductase delta subunit